MRVLVACTAPAVFCGAQRRTAAARDPTARHKSVGLEKRIARQRLSGVKPLERLEAEPWQGPASPAGALRLNCVSLHVEMIAFVEFLSMKSAEKALARRINASGSGNTWLGGLAPAVLPRRSIIPQRLPAMRFPLLKKLTDEVSTPFRTSGKQYPS